MLNAFTYRSDGVGQVSDDNKFVGDAAPGRVSASQRIREPQSDSATVTAKGAGRLGESGKRTFVLRQRVVEPGIEQKPEAPRTSASRPNELRWSRRVGHFWVLITLSA